MRFRNTKVVKRLLSYGRWAKGYSELASVVNRLHDSYLITTNAN